MSKTKLLNAVNVLIYIIIGIFVIIDDLKPSIPIISEAILAIPADIKTIILFVLLGSAFTMTGIYIVRKSKIDISPNFLTVFKSTEDSTSYIVNYLYNQAYPISPHIQRIIRKQKIEERTFRNEKEIKDRFRKNHINLNINEPFLDDLGLMENPNGTISPLEMQIDIEFKKKLAFLEREGKLDNYRIWFIYSRRYFILYYLFPSWKLRHFPPRKRLLVNYEKMEAYIPPLESFQLTKGYLQCFDICPWRPRDSLHRICERRKIKYREDEERYPLRKLIKEAEAKTSKPLAINPLINSPA